MKNYKEPYLEVVDFGEYGEIALTLVSNPVGGENLEGGGQIGSEGIPEI